MRMARSLLSRSCVASECRYHASIPQAARMDYTRRPQSLSMETSTGRKARNDKMSKHMQQLARKGKTGPVKLSQVSIQGRGLGM